MITSLHSPMTPPTTSLCFIPTISCTIIPPPPTFSTTPTSLQGNSTPPSHTSCTSEAGSHPYNLRSRSQQISPQFGLGHSPRMTKIKPTRGRPSKIKTNIRTAVVDVVRGRKSTIKRALRATEPSIPISP